MKSHQRLETETQIIFNCINKRPQAIRNIDFSKINWEGVLQRASLNRTLYIFAKNLLDMPKVPKPPQLIAKLKMVISESDKYLNKLKQTLKFIKSRLHAEIPFLIIKTKRTIPYVTLDVDVLVKPNDFIRAEKTIRLFADAQRKRELGIQRHIKIHKLLTIDLHGNLWCNEAEYLDSNFVWKNTETQEIQEIKCNIPSVDVEMALTLVHILRERRQITLLDFLFIKENSQKCNWKIILYQAKKFGWLKSLLRLVSIVNALNSIMYPEDPYPMIDLYGNNSYILKTKVKTLLKMPYVYPIPYAFEIFWDWTKNILDIPLYEILYYFFAIMRYYYTRGGKVPIYDHWFSFNKLREI